MRSILEAGFVFWGLFLVFALIVVAYLVWMVRTERRGSPSGARRNRSEGEDP
jgi:cbb3-type cytochrome oxidase subunit 3